MNIKMSVDRWIIFILKHSGNETNTAFTIARIIEEEENRKKGSMYRAVKMAARKLERNNVIVISGSCAFSFTPNYKLELEKRSD